MKIKFGKTNRNNIITNFIIKYKIMKTKLSYFDSGIIISNNDI